MEIQPVSHMGVCLDSNPPPPPGVLFLIENHNSFESGGHENKLKLWREAGIHITCQSVTVWEKSKENGGSEKPLYVFTIEGKTPEELEIVNYHYQKYLEKNTYSYDGKVKEIKETLPKHNENKTTKIIFIESELKIVTDRIKYWFSKDSLGYRIFSAYEKSREIPNWRESHRTSVYTFVHAKYLIDLREYLSKSLLKLQTEEIDTEIETSTKLTWKGRGSKTELATLIYALAQTQRITVNGTGQPATMEDIKLVLEKVFNTSISNVNDLIRTSVSTYKTTNGSKLFTEILNDFIKNYKDK